jgi:hypothetical protein
MASQFSAFSPFGNFRFSTRKPPAEVIYYALQGSQGDAFDTDWDGEQAKRLYAQSMCLGAASWILWRGANSGNPALATETLPLIEQDYGITPRPRAYLRERRGDLIAAMKAHHGARYDSIFDGLGAILGATNLVAIYIRAIPTPSGGNLPGTFPGTIDPNQGQANFVPSDKLWQVIEVIGGISSIGSPLQRAYRVIAGSSILPRVGETFICDPGHTGLTERVVISAVEAGLITCTWTKAHADNVRMTSAPYPYWLSIRRQWGFVVTDSVLQNPVLLAKAHDFLKKVMRGVSIWDFMEDNEDGTSGPFTVETGLINHTPIEEITY